MAEPPVEVQEMIRQFNVDEQRKAQERETRRALQPSREVIGTPKRQMTSKDIQKEARSMGYIVESGNGRHGMHIVAPDGTRISLPDHPGSLATGTCLAINDFLTQHREIKIRSSKT